jgi:hypothetical protein
MYLFVDEPKRLHGAARARAVLGASSITTTRGGHMANVESRCQCGGKLEILNIQLQDERVRTWLHTELKEFYNFHDKEDCGDRYKDDDEDEDEYEDDEDEIEVKGPVKVEGKESDGVQVEGFR